MKSLFKLGIAVIGAAAVTFSTVHAADWQPPGPIKLMIGFKAGGGADTQARLIAEALEKEHGWKIIPEQVTGKGGMVLASELAKAPNDGSAIGMIVTETLAYNRVAAKKSGLELKDFTPLTTTAGFQMGIVSKTDKGWKTMNDVFAAAKAGEKIRMGAMAPKLADLGYLLAKANDVEFNIVMTKGGKGVMNGINAGDLDIGFAAGIQAKAVKSGDMVNLASGLAEPLKLSPDAPTFKDLGLPYTADGYFMFAAPAGLPDEAREALTAAIAKVITNQETKAGAMITKAFGEASVIQGEDLDSYLANASEKAEKLMAAASE